MSMRVNGISCPILEEPASSTFRDATEIEVNPVFREIFSISLRYEGKRDPLLFNVTTLDTLDTFFGRDAKNLWQVTNISQDHNIKMTVKDESMRALINKVYHYAFVISAAKFAVFASAVGALSTFYLALTTGHRSSFTIEIFKNRVPIRIFYYLTYATVSIIAGVILAKSNYAEAQFDLNNRLLSMVDFASKQPKGTKVASSPLPPDAAVLSRK